MTFENLLDEVTPEAPCGPNLEYDGSFIALDQAARGKAEQQMGDTIVAAEAPNWKEVEQKATELLAQTKDLRIALFLAKAAINNKGFEGLRDGIALIKGLVEKFWDKIHPELDPDDDNDPTMRFNILSELGDGETVVSWVRTCPIVSSRAVGQFSLRDVDLATGELSLPEGSEDPKPEMSSIEAAFTSAEIEELQATHQAAKTAAEQLRELDRLLNEHAGHLPSPDLAPLIKSADQATKAVEERLIRRGAFNPEPEAPAEGEEVAASGENGQAAAATGAPVVQVVPEAVESRADVVRVLDKILDYYTRSEPSSPVPILLERTKRLVHSNFIDIVRDVAPDGLPQVEALRGRVEEEGY